MACHLTRFFKFDDGVVAETRSLACSFFKQYKKILIAGAFIISAKHLHDYVIGKKRRKKWDSVEKDVVILHAIQRGKKSAHVSPFVLKVETYLRLAGIKYVYDNEVPFGPKGKMPWITLNGEDVADSEFIVEHLKAKFKKDFSSHSTEDERAVTKAFQVLCDEYLIQGVFYYRFANGLKMFGELQHVPFHWHFFAPSSARRSLWYQGFGRHTEDEKEFIIEKNLQAISTYLGSKKFFTGEQPCEIDCVVFSHLAQYLWLLPESKFASVIQRNFKNLEEYCLRMRERFYPDWENAAMNWEP